MTIPKVTIGLPVYNGAKYLEGAVVSLLQQDYEDFELIISDNGSTDKTSEICKAFAEKDKRVRYYRNETNRGATWNYRYVFELARGYYFKWACYDDECYPSMLRRCVETFENLPKSVVLVYPKGEIMDELGRFLHVPPDHVDSAADSPHKRLGRVLFRVGLAHSFYGVFRRDALRKAREYGFIASDHVILAELAMWGEIREIPEVLFRLRWHPENAMHVNKTRHEMQLWFDPSGEKRWPMVPYEVAIMIEYLKSVNNVCLTPVDKYLCYLTVLTVPAWRHFIRFAGKKKDNLRRKLLPMIKY